LNNIKGYQLVSEKEYKMSFGTAFHLFAEHFHKRDLPLKECIDHAVDYYSKHLDGVTFPEDEFRTPSYLVNVCMAYAVRYKDDEVITAQHPITGRPLLEAKFAIPWFQTATHEFILCGTIDRVGKYEGKDTLLDYKTTSTYFGNADKFLSEFELDIQVTLYAYIYKQLNNLTRAPGFLVRGIFIKKPTELARKKGNFDGVNFKQSSSIIVITEERLLEFSVWLERWKHSMLALLDDNLLYEYPNYAFCKNSFGCCKYFALCSAPLDCRVGILDSYYTQKEYNPLHFKD
jgi:hypothetical protein